MTARRTAGLVSIVAVTLAAALFLARGAIFGSRDEKDSFLATREDFRSVITATGALEAAVSNQLGPPSIPDFWSYNLTFMAPEGSLVKAGTPVARFDATQIEDRLRESQAELETAVKEREKEEKNLEIELRQLELSLAEARADLERSRLDVAVPTELLASIEAEEYRLKDRLLRDKVALLDKKIQARRANVDAKLKLLAVKKQRADQRIRYYKDALEKFAVKAPSDGVVVYVRKRDGNRWEVGEGVWMLAKVLEVADLSTLRVSAQILEVDAGRVRAGQAASVTVDAIPGRTWKSRVADVGKLVRPRSQQDQGKVFDVFIPLGEIDAKAMRPGMGVRVEIEEIVLPAALTIPLTAVRDRAGSPMVVVAGPRGREERAVTLGPRSRERIVVKSGLQEGERVVPADAGEGAAS